MTWAVGCAVTAAAMLVGRFASPSPDAVRQVGFEALGVLLLGAAALPFQRQAGFPLVLDGSIPRSQRIVQPLLLGVLFGTADLVVFEFLARGGAHTSLPPYLQPFPYSLLLYTSGAWYVETLYRLVPLTILMALARRFLPRGAHRPLFLVLAAATALVEPLQQLVSAPAWLAIYAFATGFAMNFLQALLVRRAGWTASLTVRLGHYLVWHILNGLYVQYLVLS